MKIEIIRGMHNAFTDLVYFNKEWYLCFRKAQKHLFCYSKIVIYKSKDGKKWEVYSKTESNDDLRDPRFMVYDNELYLLVNSIYAEKGRVLSSCLLKGRINEGFTGIYQTGDRNCFITSVLGTWAFSYNPVTNGDNKIIGLQRDTPLPSFSQSTEGTMVECNKNSQLKFFIRNDTGNSYWLTKDKDYMSIQKTDFVIHCPLLIEEGKYLLGREMKHSLNKYDIIENMKISEMWLYEVKGFDLKKKRKIDGFGDCGYFGYANGLISYYSSYDIKKPNDTAVFVEEL